MRGLIARTMNTNRSVKHWLSVGSCHSLVEQGQGDSDSTMVRTQIRADLAGGRDEVGCGEHVIDGDFGAGHLGMTNFRPSMMRSFFRLLAFLMA